MGDPENTSMPLMLAQDHRMLAQGDLTILHKETSRDTLPISQAAPKVYWEENGFTHSALPMPGISQRVLAK